MAVGKTVEVAAGRRVSVTKIVLVGKGVDVIVNVERDSAVCVYADQALFIASVEMALTSTVEAGVFTPPMVLTTEVAPKQARQVAMSTLIRITVLRRVCGFRVDLIKSPKMRIGKRKKRNDMACSPLVLMIHWT